MIYSLFLFHLFFLTVDNLLIVSSFPEKLQPHMWGWWKAQWAHPCFCKPLWDPADETYGLKIQIAVKVKRVLPLKNAPDACCHGFFFLSRTLQQFTQGVLVFEGRIRAWRLTGMYGAVQMGFREAIGIFTVYTLSSHSVDAATLKSPRRYWPPICEL